MRKQAVILSEAKYLESARKGWVRTVVEEILRFAQNDTPGRRPFIVHRSAIIVSGLTARRA